MINICKRVLWVVLLGVTGLQALGQKNANVEYLPGEQKGQRVDGYILTLQGDTVRKKLVFPLMRGYLKTLMHEQIWYLDDTGGMVKVTPTMISGYGYAMEGQERRHWRTRNFRIARTVFAFDEPRFLRLVVDGKVSLYRWYRRISTTTFSKVKTLGEAGSVSAYKDMANRQREHGYALDSMYVLQRDTAKMKDVPYWGWEKDYQAFLADCPEVVQKIGGRGGYSRDDDPLVVAEYNKLCGNKP